MKLLDLPYLPLFQILRFLDDKSLVKMQFSSRALNCFIEGDRRRLAFRPIGRISMMEIVRMESSNSGILTLTFYIMGPGDKEPRMYGASEDQSDPFERTFNEWINEFSYVEIEKLTVLCPHLGEKEMDRFPYLLRINKLRSKTLLIKSCVVPNDDISYMTNFVAQINPNFLIIRDLGCKIPNHLLQEGFVEMMPSLDGLQYVFNYNQKDEYGAMEITEFPNLMIKVPSVFRISCAFHLNFQHFKRLIHGWYNDGEIKIYRWIISLIGIRENLEMGQKLGLPFVLSRREGSVLIQRTFKAARQFIYIGITEKHNVMSGAYEWVIYTKPFIFPL